MQFDHRIKFLRKIQMSKQNLFWYTIFSGNSAASLLSCLSEKKVPVFSEKFDIFGSENFFWTVRFWLNFVTNLIFFQKRKITIHNACSEYMILLRYHEHGRKRMKTEKWRNRVSIIFPKLSYLSSIERNLVIPNELEKASGLKFGSIFFDFTLRLKTCSDFGFF